MRVIPARIIDTVAPRRLGSSFRWLLSATVINNVGDGIAIAAGPLLVASQTRDPFVVSMALLSQYLPMLLFGVIGGAAAGLLIETGTHLSLALTTSPEIALATMGHLRSA